MAEVIWSSRVPAPQLNQPVLPEERGDSHHGIITKRFSKSGKFNMAEEYGDDSKLTGHCEEYSQASGDLESVNSDIGLSRTHMSDDCTPCHRPIDTHGGPGSLDYGIPSDFSFGRSYEDNVQAESACPWTQEDSMDEVEQPTGGLNAVRTNVHLGGLETSVLLKDWSNAKSSIREPRHIHVLLGRAIVKMGYEPPSFQTLEAWSQWVYNAYCGSCRLFHSLEHLSKMCMESSSEAARLAALFHDVVYLSTDGRLLDWMKPVLQDLVEVCTPESPAGGEPTYRMIMQREGTLNHDVSTLCTGVFGLDPKEDLPSLGRNEYLSALIAAKLLSQALPVRELLRIVVCIEATIPFRRFSEDSTPSQELASRLRSTAKVLGLKYSREEISDIMYDACSLANSDISDFYSLGPSGMLSNTWLLVPESNAKLWTPHYNIGDWRWAIHKLNKFFKYVLIPDQVFRRPKALPENDLKSMQLRCKRNKACAELGLSAMLISAATMEALAALTGGDLAMGSLFDTWKAAPGCDAETPRKSPRLHKPEDHTLVGETLEMLDNLVYFDFRLKTWEGYAHYFAQRCLTSMDMDKLESLCGFIYGNWKDPDTMAAEASSRDVYYTFLDQLPQAIQRSAFAKADRAFPQRAAELANLESRLKAHSTLEKVDSNEL